MKKIFTLLAASFVTIASFAADHRPVMSIQNHSYYRLMIDGRPVYNAYNAANICDVNYGRHTITVVEERGSFFFGRRAKVISSSDFRVDGDDRKIFVSVDRFGCVRISKFESVDQDRDYGWNRNNNGSGERDRNRNDHDWNNDHDRYRRY